MSKNPYLSFASSFRQLVKKGVDLPLGGIKKPPRPKLAEDAPVVLIFSPHPDDECIIGSLPLRLMREAGTRVVNVAVTLGSNKKRQQARLSELRDACDYLGFELQVTLPNGLERITPATRENEAEHWPGGDPVERLKMHLIKIGEWDEKRDSELKEKIDSEVMSAYKEAVKYGDLANGPFPPASTIFTDVYEEVPWHIQEQREELGK